VSTQSVTPDLAVTQISGPLGVQLGNPSKVQLTWTVTNQGQVATTQTSWTDRVIISTNNVLGDGDDVVVGNFVHNGALPASGNYLTTQTVTRDLFHRFFENQMQINGGANDMFAAWADAGGLTMGHFDYSGSAIYQLAQQYVLADHFFEGAFGGSFLNHQYLICACAPEYPNADTAAAHPTIAVVDTDTSGNFLPRLTLDVANPASALSGPAKFKLSGNLAPANYFGDGKFHAINTMQPAYQPSYVKPAATDASGQYADPLAATTLPVQTRTTIGDLLTGREISWAW
jgi:acid phosphatase